jgi:5'(3')-deoxyribonucleotidase
MPRLLLDCDGVLSNFVESALKFIYTRTNVLYRAENVLDHDTFEFLGVKDLEEDLRNEIDRCAWCYNLSPFPGAKQGVERLSKVAEVVIVTAPFDASGWVMQRNNWLKNHMDISETHIVHTQNKGHVRGDFLVDDKVENCIEWNKANPQGTPIIWDRPYNRGSLSQGIRRVCTWDELYDIVNKSCSTPVEIDWSTVPTAAQVAIRPPKFPNFHRK